MSDTPVCDTPYPYTPTLAYDRKLQRITLVKQRFCVTMNVPKNNTENAHFIIGSNI